MACNIILHTNGIGRGVGALFDAVEWLAAMLVVAAQQCFPPLTVLVTRLFWALDPSEMPTIDAGEVNHTAVIKMCSYDQILSGGECGPCTWFGWNKYSL